MGICNAPAAVSAPKTGRSNRQGLLGKCTGEGTATETPPASAEGGASRRTPGRPGQTQRQSRSILRFGNGNNGVMRQPRPKNSMHPYTTTAACSEFFKNAGLTLATHRVRCRENNICKTLCFASSTHRSCGFECKAVSADYSADRDAFATPSRLSLWQAAALLWWRAALFANRNSVGCFTAAYTGWHNPAGPGFQKQACAISILRNRLPPKAAHRSS